MHIAPVRFANRKHFEGSFFSVRWLLHRFLIYAAVRIDMTTKTFGCFDSINRHLSISNRARKYHSAVPSSNICLALIYLDEVNPENI